MPKQIGYAVAGLGESALRSVVPAFARAADNSRLIAIVSSDRASAHAVAQEFRATPYHYDEFRQCLTRDDVQAVYIALPNSMHCDATVEAARAGVHVLCERPMALTADECRRMIRTCQTNRVKLMIGYGLPFQPAHVRAQELVRAGDIGVPKTFSSDFTIRIQDSDDIRLQRRLGGGTVYELGVLCIHAARSMFELEPAQVMAMTARTTRRYGGDVDAGTVALIRFPEERLAHFHTSFGEEPHAALTIFGEHGWLRVNGAYGYGADATLALARDGRVDTFQVESSETLPAELEYFSDCILKDHLPEPSGIQGLQDVRVVEAIYRSARDGRPVTLPRLERAEPSSAEQELRKPLAERRHAS